MTATWTPEQRRAAAADLCERAARMLRVHEYPDRVTAISVVLELLPELWDSSDDPESVYRRGLDWFDVAPADRDAAVAAILAGSHPPDSLPGRLSSLAITDRAEAQRLWDTNMYDGGALRGRADLAAVVLSLIGCPTPPALTKETP